MAEIQEYMNHMNKSRPQVGNPQNGATLYIGDLPKNAIEEELFNIFKKNDSLVSIKICRDNATGNCLGYGYANFNSVDKASQAMKHMNFAKLGNKEIRVMWPEPDSTLRRSGVGNVFVKNLDESIDNKTFNDTFSVFGPIMSSKVVLDHNGRSLGYGFVHYRNPEDAQKAIKMVNGKIIASKQVLVTDFLPRSKRLSSIRNFTNVYVKNFTGKDFENQAEFEKFFSQFGTVTSSMLREHNGGKFFGFVNFQDAKSAREAIEKAYELKPSIYVAKALPRSVRKAQIEEQTALWRQEIDARVSGRNLYVKNLPEEFTRDNLIQLFSKFGNIESVKLETDQNGRSKGFGYVLFETQSNAAEAIKEMHGKNLNSKTLFVALWQRKSVRQMHNNQASFARRIGSSFQPGMMVPGVYQNPSFIIPPFPMAANPPGRIYVPPQQQMQGFFENQPMMMPRAQQQMQMAMQAPQQWDMQQAFYGGPVRQAPEMARNYPQQFQPYPAQRAAPSGNLNPDQFHKEETEEQLRENIETVKEEEQVAAEDREVKEEEPEQNEESENLASKIFFTAQKIVGTRAGDITNYLIEHLTEEEMAQLMDDQKEIETRIQQVSQKFSAQNQNE